MKTSMRVVYVLLWLAIGLLGGAGCSTYEERVASAVDAYTAGDYDAAQADLSALRDDDSSNRQLYDLNLGVVELARGRPDLATARLREGRDRMQDLAKSGYLAWFGAMLTDDTALDYPGEDYERILTLALLALSDLMGDGQDADAYALQVWDAQQEIIDSFKAEGDAKNPKKNYQLVGFGSYLRGIMSEDDPTKRDVARREFEKVVALEPSFAQGSADVARMKDGKHSTRGHGIVHIIGLVGLAPKKIEVSEPVSSGALAIAQVAWNLIRERGTIPVISAVKVPALVRRGDNPTELLVSIDGKAAGRTETVTDVEAVALQQFEELRDWIVARAVLRRVFKLTVIEGAKEISANNSSRKNSGGNPWANIGIDLLGNLWAATERADTRTWTLLPAKLQASRLELPVGDYTLELRAGVNGNAVGAPQSVAVTVRDGFNTYVMVIAPTPRGGPAPLTSNGPEKVGDPTGEAELESAPSP